MTSTVEEVKKPVPADGGSAAPVPKGGWRVHKPGEGQASRLGMFVVCVLFTIFTCHHWFFNWILLRDFLMGVFEPIGIGGLLAWSRSSASQFTISAFGAAVIFGLGLLIGYYYIYVKTRSAEFLVLTDIELKKVTWPKITPWFKPDTHVWGATYVVLIVVTALTLFVLGVDTVLGSIAEALFSAPK